MNAEHSGRRTIEADDSGWGALVGGVILTFSDPSTGRTVFKEIPVECFQGRAFADKEYLKKSAELADEAVEELGLTPENAEFRICTGYVNNAVAERLASRGFRVTRTKIVGATQELAEKAFEDVLKQITGIQSFPQSGRQFFILLNWVRQDLENRERFVKTGWKSWSARWRNQKKG
jgi:hypothetical protein